MSNNDRPAMSKIERRELAARVRELREARGMKQEELAALTGLPRTTISNMENGKTPQQATLERVLDVLGVERNDPAFHPQTQIWLTTIGTLIESIPDPRRQVAVDESIRVLAGHLRGDVGGAPDPLDMYDPNNFTPEPAADFGLAAKTGEAHPTEP